MVYPHTIIVQNGKEFPIFTLKKGVLHDEHTQNYG